MDLGYENDGDGVRCTVKNTQAEKSSIPSRYSTRSSAVSPGCEHTNSLPKATLKPPPGFGLNPHSEEVRISFSAVSSQTYPAGAKRSSEGKVGHILGLESDQLHAV